MHSNLERRSPAAATLLKQIETQFKWLFFWLFLRLSGGDIRRQTRVFDPIRFKKVLVLRHDRIGDMVITLPALHALKAHWPHLQIDVLASPINHLLIRDDSSVNRIFVYEKKNLQRSFSTLRTMRAQKYDAVIDPLTGVSITALALTAFVGPNSFKLGISKQVLGTFYDFYSHEDLSRKGHVSQQIEECLGLFGIDLDEADKDCSIRLSQQQWRKGVDLIESIRLTGYSRLIGINISAGRINRSWDEHRYSEVLKRLSPAYPDFQFIIFCVPDEREKAKMVVAAGGRNVSLIPPRLSITDVVAMIRNLYAVVSPDTAICHIAASLDIPLLALYSADEHNFKRMRPFARSVWHIRGKEGDTLDSISVDDFLHGFASFVRDLQQVAAVGR